MAEQNFFDHTDLDGLDPGDRARKFSITTRYIGENISAGQETAREACRDLYHSPGHRRNILNPHYKRIGTGFARGPGKWKRYYVQIFAS